MQVPLTSRHWDRADYERLIGLGILAGEPLELIGGQIMVAEPQGAYHASTITDRLRTESGGAARLHRPPSVADLTGR